MHIFFLGGQPGTLFFFQSCQVGRFCDALGDQAIHSLVLAAGVTALEAREDWRLEMGFIDLLISHASCSYDVQQMSSVEETCDGYEMHFGLNYLSRFNMVGMGRLKCGEKVKVCFVLHVLIQIRACGAICACHYFSRCNFHTIFNLKYFCTLSYFIPKRQNALASQTPWFNRFDVISHESRKPKRTAVHSADLRSGLSFDGEPQEGWHARGSLQSNFAWMYAYCTCVCYPCMSKHYKTEWYTLLCIYP